MEEGKGETEGGKEGRRGEEREQKLSSVSFYKGNNPIYEGATLMTKSPPKALSSKYQHNGD